MAISDFKRKNALKREWDALMKREQAYLTRQSGQKESALNRLLADKVPDKLQATLDAAFEKAFTLIFEKGTGIIEKTCNKTATSSTAMPTISPPRARPCAPFPRTPSARAVSTCSFPACPAWGWGCSASACPISRFSPPCS